jgi:hypothetical protein
LLQATASDPLGAFVVETAPCPEDVRYRFGLALHVITSESGEPTRDARWLDVQLSEARRHFASIHTAFEIDRVDRLDRRFAHVASREDRDAIGRGTFSRGVIHVFLVERLDDVDVAGEVIRGLHWRQRSNIDKRWVILSRIAPDMVLAHELGHFFGLPHSTYAVSIMNKRRREQPPRAERTFAVPEIVTMRRERNAMVRERMLSTR